MSLTNLFYQIFSTKNEKINKIAFFYLNESEERLQPLFFALVDNNANLLPILRLGICHFLYNSPFYNFEEKRKIWAVKKWKGEADFANVNLIELPTTGAEPHFSPSPEEVKQCYHIYRHGATYSPNLDYKTMYFLPETEEEFFNQPKRYDKQNTF